MPRESRISPGGLVYQVTNRTWGDLRLFKDAGDCEALERVPAELRVERASKVHCAAPGRPEKKVEPDIG